MFVRLGLCVAIPAAAAVAHAQPALTLGDAARLAAERAAPAAIARTRVDQAQARLTQRRSELLPQLSGGLTQADRTFNTATLGLQFELPGAGRPLFDPRGEVLGPVPTVDLRARVQQNLVDIGAWARLRAARAAIGVADREVLAQAEGAAIDAASSYVRALRAEATLAMRGADSTLAAELLRIARDQLAAGVGIALDVTRAEAQAALVRAQLIAARADQQRTRVDLRRALALPLDAPIAFGDSLGAHLDTADPSVDQAMQDALRTRADLQLLSAQQTATASQLRATRAERLPSLGLVADRGVIGRNYSRMLSTYTWGVQLSLPAFDGFRREGRVSEQAAHLRELDLRERELRAQVEADVHMALLDLVAAREQTVATRERVRLGEQEVAQARERFAGGVAGNGEVITASLNLTSARTLLVDALAQFQFARLALARAQGSVTRLP
ncbi:MAG: TolC family protein [Gemmatimonadaceae bacterium]|jgi:outer membrane protein TolC|nr:TolC family protein [Gemmatimonadaceae bacterium]